MKHKITLWMALLLTAFGLNAQNLAVNGDFESWTGSAPDGWTSESGTTITQETTTVHGGSSSAKFEVTTATQGNTDFRQTISVTSGTTYNVSVWVYQTDGGSRARLYVGDYRNYSDPTILNSWQELTYEYTATATGTLEIGLRFYDISGSFTGSSIMYIDDFMVPDPASGSVVATPTFDPAAGTYTETQNVSISTTTEGASIFYTLDGTDPATTVGGSTMAYSTPIAVASTTTIKAIATKSGEDDSSIASAEYAIVTPTEVGDIATLRAGATDGSIYTFTGEAFIQAINSYNGQKYIQDASAGILIYDASGNITTSFSEGDCISNITGTLTTSNGMLRFIPSADANLVASPLTTAPAAQVITADEFNTNFDSYEAELIQIVAVTYSSTGTFANGSNYNFSDASASAVMRTDIWDVDFIGTSIPTGSGSITGVALEYNSTAQIVARSSADLSFSAGDPTIYVDPTSVSNLNYQLGAGPSSSQSISVSGSDLEADITVSAPTNFEISLDDVTFSSSVTTPMSGAATTVYVRLAEGLSITSYSGDITLSSTNASSVTVGLSGAVTEVTAVADFMMINEVDADNPGTDALEFVELYDGGLGNTDLSGLVIVFFNGNGDVSYAAYDLDGYSTNANGFFVLGNAGVANVDMVFTDNFMQNGADAVALYVGDDSSFPNGTAVTTTSLLDAVVYDTSDGDDEGLLVLLNEGEPQLDENGIGNKDDVSLGRWTDGAGGQRNTSSYQLTWSTPGAINNWGVATGLNKTEAELKVYAVNRTITIESGISPVSVYSLDGKLVYQGQTQNSRTEITVAQSGVYFVRLQNSTTKVIVR